MSSDPVPVQDDPSTGLVAYEDPDVPDLQPADMVVVAGETEDRRRFTVLSVREGDDGPRPYVYDEVTDEYRLFDREGFREWLDRDDAYHWRTLYRDATPRPGGGGVAAYAYAFEAPSLDDGRALLLGWEATDECPPTRMPDLDGHATAPTFERLRGTVAAGAEGIDGFLDRVTPDDAEETAGGLVDYLDAFLGEAADEGVPESAAEAYRGFLDRTVVAAEFNARRMHDVDEEPTYDEETAERLREAARSRDEAMNDGTELV